MKKNTVIISAALLVLVGAGSYFALANDDYTCYNYTSSDSCSIDKSNCTEWANSKRTCYGTKTTTYTRGNSYRCSTFNSEDRASYSVNSTCSQEFTDTTAPKVTDGGVE